MNIQNHMYCSNCGAKNSSTSNFCSSCGNKIETFSSIKKSNLSNRNLEPVKNNASEVDEEGIPTVFRKPSKLHYEIEKPISNKFSGEELFKAAPSEEKNKRNKIAGYKKMSKEEFLRESMKECSSRKSQDIDET